MRHYFMKDVNIIIADPGNTKAILAVSALARAMKEMDKAGILQCVWRQGHANAVVGVLTPNVSDKDNIVNGREFQFPSFGNLLKALQPSKEQQEAADNLVPAGKEEALQPDFTPNPILEQFYHHLELRSKNPDAAVPPLDETLKRIIEPDLKVLDLLKDACELVLETISTKGFEC